MEQTILAISGKPGLYQLVARSSSSLIVESIDDKKKRFSVSMRDRITSLGDISIYTEDEDVSLLSVFAAIGEQQNYQPVEMNVKKASKEELAAFLATVLPNFDRDRVYPNDMKKIILWYNTLVGNGITDFAEPEENAETAAENQTSAEN